MKSLQAQYVQEREGVETVESEKYFFTYKHVEDEFHCYDMFVAPEFRGSEVTHEMLGRIDELAKQSGKKYLVGFVNQGDPFIEKSLTVQFKYGMKVLKIEDKK